MLTASLMRSMSAHHLVAAARTEQDALTSTALELELLDRIETLLAAQQDTQPVADLLEEYEVSVGDVKLVIESHPGSLREQASLLFLLNDADIHEPDQLRKLLDFVARFRSLASNAGDFLTRLNDLVTTSQE